MEKYSQKEVEALSLKTDSFAVESNVHFPTDYNLLWDCTRKSPDMPGKLEKKYGQLSGWRRNLKSRMRVLGQSCDSGGGEEKRRTDESLKGQLCPNVNKIRLLTKIFFPFCIFFPVFNAGWIFMMEKTKKKNP
jgi:hypothetical protein